MKTLPFYPYEDDPRYVLINRGAALDAGIIRDDRQDSGPLGSRGPKTGILDGPPVGKFEEIVRGMIRDLGELIRTDGPNPGGSSGRSLDREIDFPGGSTPVREIKLEEDLATRSFDTGMKEVCRILRSSESSKEDQLAAFYYQLGALSSRGLGTWIDPVKALNSSANVTRSCDSRGSGCRDLGDKIDRMLREISSGGRGVGREVGDWADKVRDCIFGD